MSGSITEEMRSRIGMVVPVWFPDDLTVAETEERLAETLADSEKFVSLPNNAIVVDGMPKSHEAARNLRERYLNRFAESFTLLYAPENQGKAAAAAAGIEALLEREDVELVAVRDCDGDHLIDDLPNLYRAARHIQSCQRSTDVMIIGSRSNIYRPVGFVRAQFEFLLNQCIVQSLNYALAREGQVLNTQFLLSQTGVPDIQSGYKLYSRSVCRHFLPIWKGEKMQAGLDVYRYGCEIIPFVESALAGVTIGEASRATCDQPSSSYAGIGLTQMYASRMVWVFRRLAIGHDSARQILDNNIVRAILNTDADGREVLSQFRAHILTGLDEANADARPAAEIPAAAWC